MKPLLHLAVLSSVRALSACATPATDEPSASAPAARRAPMVEQDTLTGSRIPARRTEKMVGAVGAKDYQETSNAQPAPLRTN